MKQPRLDPAAEGAIDWMVRLSAGNTDTALQAQFDLWLASDPSHAQAWKRLQERLGGACQTVRSLDRRAPGQAGEARRVLLQPTTSRRDLLRSIAALGVLGGGLWLGARSQMGEALLADLRTGRGERRNFTLADGSRLSLNAGSAVDLQFDAQQRLLILRQGSLLIRSPPIPRARCTCAVPRATCVHWAHAFWSARKPTPPAWWCSSIRSGHGCPMAPSWISTKAMPPCSTRSASKP